MYDHPRTVDEVYIWANGEPGRVPLYFDFLLEAKSKVEAKVAELGIPWEVDDYQALPDWKPGCGYEVTDPGFDIPPRVLHRCDQHRLVAHGEPLDQRDQ